MTRLTRFGGIAALALVAGTGAAHAAGSLKARVMVLPAQGTASDARLPADLAQALTDGAKKVTPNVARSTASLADTAVIVGCDPVEQACLEAVAAALNVDQMLLVTLKSEAGGDVTVDVTAVSREAPPVTRQFVVHAATRKQDLAKIEAAVPGMLDAEARVDGGTGTGDGSGGTGIGSGGTGIGNGGTGDGNGAGAGTGPGPVDGGTRSTRGPMAVTIAGGALAVLGLGAWTIAAVKQGNIDDAPASTAADLDRLADMERSARGYATAGNGLVIAGVVTAAAGAVWWWKVGRASDTVVAPMVGPDQGGVVLEGRW